MAATTVILEEKVNLRAYKDPQNQLNGVEVTIQTCYTSLKKTKNCLLNYKEVLA